MDQWRILPRLPRFLLHLFSGLSFASLPRDKHLSKDKVYPWLQVGPNERTHVHVLHFWYRVCGCFSPRHMYVCMCSSYSHLRMSVSVRICLLLLLRLSASVVASVCACFVCPFLTTVYTMHRNINSPIYALNCSFLYYVGFTLTYLCIGLCNTGCCGHPVGALLCGVEI